MNKALPLIASTLFLGFILLLYWAGMAPGIVWEPVGVGDLLASLTHSQFYTLAPSPLYFVLGQIWARLGPLTHLALRGNLVSLIFAALGVFLVYLTVLKITQNLGAALLGGLWLAVFPKFWYFALFANFYTFWFFLSWLAMFSLFCFKGYPRRSLILASFIAALSFSCFSLGIVFAIPVVVFGWVHHQTLRFGDIAIAVSVFLLTSSLVLGVGYFLGLPLAEFFVPLQPLDPLVGSFWQNVILFAESFLGGPWWALLPLVVLGLLFGGGTMRSTLQSFTAFFIIIATYPLTGMVGSYLPLWAVVMVGAALGFDILWKLALTFSDTEIGTAFENGIFVLVFRLKREARVLRVAALGFLILFSLGAPFWKISLRFSELSRAEDMEALHYGEQAWAVLSPSSVVVADEGRYLSVLRYFGATREGKDVLVTHSGLGLDREELSRIGEFYPEVKTPPALDFVETSAGALEGLRDFVFSNSPERDFFFTLDRPSKGDGRRVGEWRGFSLVTKEPLYQVVE